MVSSFQGVLISVVSSLQGVLISEVSSFQGVLISEVSSVLTRGYHHPIPNAHLIVMGAVHISHSE